ncbi:MULTISPECIES: adenosine deaminase family protein [Idiomarina]|uniref:adenosine deaminase family protein n=1 Tax=Idiomarina TaxID=135575 RepID=UPI000C6B3657|nr:MULTISPECIES: adenosine deaminase family protein [Idiomarina]MBL74234.1 adenosine deaminase [Idiomarinaceae bacterium]|tara:strand:+ start:1278 stop:2516 length:1239 start_codon:yes stop_codon:yes gene_type:complete
MQYPADFIKAIPKADLHLHLDGSLRASSLIDMAKRASIELPSYTEEGLFDQVFKSHYNNLGEYLNGFQYTCAALRNLENLEQAAYELAIDNQEEGVNYIEVRFAPQLLMNPAAGVTFDTIMHVVNDGLKRAKNEYNQQPSVQHGEKPPFDYGIINCAMRMFGKKGFSPYYTQLFQHLRDFEPMQVIRTAAMELVRASVRMRDDEGLPIVGLDIAGQEIGYPASQFKDVYEYAHENFLLKTVHAGEAYGAESIFEALTQCHADRLGHGYSLFSPEMTEDPSIEDPKAYGENLASYIADRRIAVEVCLTSNLQTNPSIGGIENHNFKHMLDNRLATVICTDNRLVSRTTVSNEYQLAVDNFDISLKRLKDMVAYGFKKNFFPGDYVAKREYAKTNLAYFDKVVEQFGLKDASHS